MATVVAVAAAAPVVVSAVEMVVLVGRVVVEWGSEVERVVEGVGKADLAVVVES